MAKKTMKNLNEILIFFELLQKFHNKPVLLQKLYNKYKLIELEKKRSNLIAIINIKQEHDLWIKKVRDEFNNLPLRLSDLIAAESDPIKVEEILQNKFNRIFEIL